MAKRIVISTTNDIATDQRMQKYCKTLNNAGYEILWTGRWKKNSLPVDEKHFKARRFVLLFNKGPLFYFSYNWRLFWFLLFSKADLFLAVDLDTAPAHFLASKIRRKPLVIDNHEYFTGVPELQNRDLKKNTWKTIERSIYKRCENFITVNDSLKDIFEKEYSKHFEVIKNYPLINDSVIGVKRFPDKTITVVYQGVLNKDRGLEESIVAFKLLPENYRLMIAGDGDIKNELMEIVEKNALQNKVVFIGRLSPEKLISFTKEADAGISFEKDTNINYRYSLPNKLFDYMNAGIPVLVSDLPEMRKVVEENQCGSVLKQHTPEKISELILELFSDKDRYLNYCAHSLNASSKLNWESQENNIIEFFNRISVNK